MTITSHNIIITAVLTIFTIPMLFKTIRMMVKKEKRLYGPHSEWEVECKCNSN